MTSEPQTGTKPATPRWPVKHCNHWATKAQMVSQVASLTYMCDPSGSHYTLSHIYVKLVPWLTIWVLVAQWLEHLTSHQRVAGLVPIWGLEVVFLGVELGDHSSISIIVIITIMIIIIIITIAIMIYNIIFIVTMNRKPRWHSWALCHILHLFKLR